MALLTEPPRSDEVTPPGPPLSARNEAQGPQPRADLGHRPGHREHRRHRGVHHAGGDRRGGHHGHHRARRHRRGRHAPGRPVRSAHPPHPQQRRRPLRLQPPRIRRLRRLPGGLVLLDPVLGRQRRHRVLLGVLRRRPVRLGPSVGHGQLGHRHGRAVGAGPHQPGRRPPDGVVPEHHRGAQVPATAVRGHRRMVLRHLGPLRPLQRLGRQPLQRHRHRRRGGPVLLHRCRGGGGHGKAGAQSPGERRSGLDPRHRAECGAVRAGDRRGHGPGRPPHAGQHRVALRQRLRLDVPPQLLGREVHRRRGRRSPASVRSTGGR